MSKALDRSKNIPNGYFLWSRASVILEYKYIYIYIYIYISELIDIRENFERCL